MVSSSLATNGNSDQGRDLALRQLLRPLAPFLEDREVSELAVNRPGRVFTRGGYGWQEHGVPELTHEYLDSLIRALAVFNGLPMGPMLTVILPGGQRGQVVREPACVRGFTPVVIRKHAPASIRPRGAGFEGGIRAGEGRELPSADRRGSETAHGGDRL